MGGKTGPRLRAFRLFRAWRIRAANFTDGTIGRWLAESLAVYRQFAKGPQVVVGSSMGGWLALLLAARLRELKGSAPLAGMVLIAPAVDFTEELMWKQFPDDIKREIEEKGAWMRPSQYSEEPYPITKRLIEEGREHLLLGGLIETGCPVHILQGVQDPDVPWRHAVRNWWRALPATTWCSR